MAKHQVITVRVCVCVTMRVIYAFPCLLFVVTRYQVGNNSPGPIYLVPTDNWKCKQAPPKRTFDGVVVPSWR
jgi:hypothetical protein